jgi:hypothetical protein
MIKTPWRYHFGLRLIRWGFALCAHECFEVLMCPDRGPVPDVDDDGGCPTCSADAAYAWHLRGIP